MMIDIKIGILILCLGFVLFTNGAKLEKKPKESVVLTDNAFCENQLSAFYVSDNTNVVSNSSTVIHNTTEAQCIDMCANNRDLKGRLVFCASVAYNAKTSTCTIYRQSSAPDGELRHKIEDGQRFFEKFCLADDLPSSCAGKQFVRVDDYILKGYAQSTSVVPTLAECVAQCVREKEFQCKSAMYFYEEGECITNLESAITQPDDFMKPDDDDKVIFFHNGCVEHSISISENVDSDGETIEISETTEDRESLNKETQKKNEQSNSESETSVSTTSELSEVNPIVTEAATELSSSTTEQVPVTTTASNPPSTTEEPTSTKSMKLLVKEKIKPIAITSINTTPTFSTTKWELALETPIAPSFNVGSKENSTIKTIQVFNTRDVQARLYGAKQLEKTEDGFIREKLEGPSNQTQSNTDNGPEGPPSGQIVVEDVVHASEKDDRSSPKLDIEKELNKAAPPAFAPLPEHLDAKPEPKIEEVIVPHATIPEVLLEHESKGMGLATNDFEQAPIVNEEQAEPERLIDENSLTDKIEPTKRLQLKPLKKLDDQFFGQWEEWTPCNEPGERKLRKRKCFDLRRCKGPLMQIDYCPQDLAVGDEGTSSISHPASAESLQNGPEGPVRTPLPVNIENTPGSAGLPPSILPPKLPEKELKPLPAGAPGHPEDIWSPWLGTCQHFASVQPCKNNQVIGFESRECIARDPKACKGPFFRYCTLSC